MSTQEWRSLFDGKSFSGWSSKRDDHGWVITDGMLHCANPQGGGGRKDLYTLEDFSDFELELEFRVAQKTNSGVFFRVSDIDHPKDWRFTGLEMQIIDPASHESLDPKQWCGAVYDLVAPTQDASRPAGEWNQVRIACRGPKVEIALNDVLVSEMDLSRYTEPNRHPDGSEHKFPHAYAELPPRGRFGLQDHNGEVWFRNIRVREIK